MANEKQLIDAVPYKEFLHQYAKDLAEMDAPMIAGAIGRCLTKLNAQPTVDAVEVVRCGNCVCYEETCPGYGYCYHWDYEQGMSPNQVESDDFCSYGERR